MGPTRPSGSAAKSTTKKISSLVGKSESAERQQANLHEFLKKSKIFPQQKQQQAKQKEKQKEKEEEQKPKESKSKILDGVVACIDVRTEDGDDVSLNFEEGLKSLGAKTRRTFSDSVTHLIFQNGSTATLKKALSKRVFIMKLLWISECKKAGRRLDEKDYIIEKPQGLVLTGTKRRKSMEPGKVRALALNGQGPDLLEPSTSSSSEGSSHEDNQLLPSDRRRVTLDLAEKKRLSMAQRELKRRKLQEELEGYEEDEEKGQAKTPRLSLPINVESLASRHNNEQQQNKLTIPIHAPSAEMKEQIKARFSIGQIEENNSPSSSKPTPSRLSLSSTPSASPIKRKRRLTGSLLKPSPVASPSISSSSSMMKNESSSNIPAMVAPLSSSTVVFTSMTPALRKQCMEVIKRLGKFQIASNVDDRTTHIICGSDRRTKSVVLGLLRGAWVIKPEWILESTFEYSQEENYEIKGWAPAAKRRQTKLIFPQLVVKVELEQAESDAVKEIIEIANGICLTENSEDATIVISSNRRIAQPGKTVVSSHWLYDSVGQWKALPTDKYIISKK